MRPDRAFVVVQSAMAVLSVALVTASVANGLPDAATLTAAAPGAVALAGALLVLGFYNVWLPRGDAVDTTVPIAFAAGVLLHPLLATGVVLLSRCATVALRPHGHTVFTAVEQVGRRMILISLTYAVLRPLIAGGLDPTRAAEWLGPVTASAVVFIALDALVEQLHASVRFRAPLRAMVFGAIRLQGWMLAAEMSTAVLAVVLFGALPYWGLVITVGLLLVMRQSFAVLLEVRASYTSTVEVLARSIEAYDSERRGHAERVARMCGEGGRMIGLQGKRLESLTYAALFHDVGYLGSDDAAEGPVGSSAALLESVGFLSQAVPILRILDNAADDDASLDEDDLISAYLVARFSVLDGELNTGVKESEALANAVGARLYASTRSAAERAVARVEADARSGSLPPGSLADVMT